MVLFSRVSESVCEWLHLWRMSQNLTGEVGCSLDGQESSQSESQESTGNASDPSYVPSSSQSSPEHVCLSPPKLDRYLVWQGCDPATQEFSKYRAASIQRLLETFPGMMVGGKLKEFVFIKKKILPRESQVGLGLEVLLKWILDPNDVRRISPQCTESQWFEEAITDINRARKCNEPHGDPRAKRVRFQNDFIYFNMHEEKLLYSTVPRLKSSHDDLLDWTTRAYGTDSNDTPLYSDDVLKCFIKEFVLFALFDHMLHFKVRINTANNPMQQTYMKTNAYHHAYFTVINVQSLPDVAVLNTSEILLLLEGKSQVERICKSDGTGQLVLAMIVTLVNTNKEVYGISINPNEYVIYKISEKKNSIEITEVFTYEHENRGIVYLKSLIYWIREICGADG